MTGKPMNDAVRHLRDWCMKECESMRQSIELMKSGVFRTRRQVSGGAMEDTTDATIAEYEMKIAELEVLLKRIKEDHA